MKGKLRVCLFNYTTNLNIVYKMKKILELQGVQKLNRQQQLQIRGARFQGCCSRNSCRIGPGGRYCEPGRCSSYRCIFY